MVAAEFVHWLALPPGSAWLDFGCGSLRTAGDFYQRIGPAEELDGRPQQA